MKNIRFSFSLSSPLVLMFSHIEAVVAKLSAERDRATETGDRALTPLVCCELVTDEYRDG